MELDPGYVLRLAGDAFEKGNFHSAREACLYAAEKGHADGQRWLALMYENGIGGDKNDTKAFEWYKAAAEQNHADAKFCVGMMYHSGNGVKQDFAKAIEWLESAAKQGHDDAAHQMGVLYLEGDGVAKDPKKAVEWLELEIKQNPHACRITLDLAREALAESLVHDAIDSGELALAR